MRMSPHRGIGLATFDYPPNAEMINPGLAKVVKKKIEHSRSDWLVLLR